MEGSSIFNGYVAMSLRWKGRMAFDVLAPCWRCFDSVGVRSRAKSEVISVKDGKTMGTVWDHLFFFLGFAGDSISESYHLQDGGSVGKGKLPCKQLNHGLWMFLVDIRVVKPWVNGL